MARSRNPIGFTPWPVTLIVLAVYTALFGTLIRIHTHVPAAPDSAPARWSGVNLTQSWMDLQTLTKQHHPYDSRANDRVRDWLFSRIDDICRDNEITKNGAESHSLAFSKKAGNGSDDTESRQVTVFDNDHNNVLLADFFGHRPIYFEGNNIVVYIRGSRDEPGDWWRNGTKYKGPGGVLVNAHFDSVPSGYGATDTGMGVISILQIISHFTASGNQPEKGILAMLNDAEELGLLGATAFAKTPLSQFPHTFVNLEGAGAGSKAMLFRTTDAQIAKHYKGVKHPFGTIFSQNAYDQGASNSYTDYTVFADQKGMRGMDILFYEPRARYHTAEDDARDTSPDSLWHMLEPALTTVESLSNDNSADFDGDGNGGHRRVDAGSGDDGVWFDVLGHAFALIKLHDLFALSVTLLVVGPLALLGLHATIARLDKFYPFAGSVTAPGSGQVIKLYGIRGFFRFPLAFVLSTTVVVLLALLVTKLNPYILYSSFFAVWAMMLSAWICSAWFLLRLGDAVRPSALTRYYSLVWLYALTWIALVINTVLMDQKDIGGGYFVVIFHEAVFVALLIAYLEFFALPRKMAFAESEVGASSDIDDGNNRRDSEVYDENARRSEDANETTSLLGSRPNFKRKGRDRRRSSGNQSAGESEAAGHHNEAAESGVIHHEAHEGEQAWSAPLPGWTWILQFLILGPINIILIGQLALLITSAVYQTAEDGNRPLPQYLSIAILTVILLLPLTPFLHRIKWQIPTVLFLVSIGTAIYCLYAFPFSRNARLKIRFKQYIDLDAGTNQVSLSSNDGYVQMAANSMPSAQMGAAVHCGSYYTPGLVQCSWDGLPAYVMPGNHSDNDWISIDTSRAGDQKQGQSRNSSVELRVKGVNSRFCQVFFDQPLQHVSVNGLEYSVQDDDWKYDDVRDTSRSIKLFSRSFESNVFNISASGVAFDDNDDDDNADDHRSSRENLVTGRVECSWDEFDHGQLPAYEEALAFCPVWSIPVVPSSMVPLLSAAKHFSI